MGDNALSRSTEPRVTRGTDNKFPHAARTIVAVDAALLTVDLDRRQLLVVEMEREDTGKWALPGTFLKDRETLSGAVSRCLEDKLGVRGVRPQQLEVFDDPDRDERARVISVAHVAVIGPEHLESLGSGLYRTRVMPVDRPGELVWDHSRMVRLAKEHVRSRYEVEPDPDRLLGPRFTLSDLQLVHEAVAGDEFSRFAFRRAMKERIEATGDFNDNTGTRGRPAELFRRKRDRH
ncbi:MAG: NUDIX hydrolase [Mycobacterium sp.]